MTRDIWLILLLATSPFWSGEPLFPAEAASRPECASGGAAVEAAMHRGIDFLVARQNPDGSWGSARNTKGLNIYAPVPGAHHAFRTGVTSLCISALLEADPGGAKSRDSLRRGEAWLVKHLPRLRRATPDAIYNVWGHAYAIQALVRLIKASPEDGGREAKLRELLRGQIGMLKRYEFVDGGWGYYDFRIGTQKPAGSSSSFTTATCLVALAEARDIGIAVPDKLVQRAVASVRRQRKPDFSYLYGESHKWRPMGFISRPGGSLGRSQVCNLALRLWGDQRITDKVLRSWLQRLFDRNLWLDMGRKRPIPHESWFQVAGYFYYYGHYYAALCIGELDEEQRSPFQRRLASLLVPLQEKDGSWWDYPLYDYHQQYGTAFALMSLARCR